MTKKRVLIIMSIFILIVAAAIAGFFGYLQFSVFEVSPIEKNALTNYIDNENLNMLSRKQDSIYEGNIPIKVLQDEVTFLFINETSITDNEVVSAEIDLTNNFAKVNYLSGSLYTPIYYNLESAIIENQLNVTLVPNSYGTRQIQLPDFLNQLFFKEISSNEIIVKLNIEEYNPSELFEYRSAKIDHEGLMVEMNLNLPDLAKLVNAIKNDLEEDLVNVYKEGSSEQMEAYKWLMDYNDNQGAVTAKIFEDFTDQATIIEEMLVLAKPATLQDIYEDYPIISSKIGKDVVIEKRGHLIGEAVVSYGQYILASLQKLSEEGNLILSQSYPFDYENFETITIEKLMDLYDIPIPEEIVNQMTMSFAKDEMYVVYQSDEGHYISINRYGYENITETEYNEDFYMEVPEVGELTIDVAIYEELYFALFSYYGEDVFIRYLKNDTDEAYAIISLESDYQNFKLVALKKLGDVFEVYTDSFESVIELNQLYPDFNMNLVTLINEETQMLYLNTRTKNNVIAGLEDKGYMQAGEELIFCSYDGVRYISMVLSSGEEYIYTIYRGTHLEKVYPLEEALEKFDNIDPIIILHPNPNSEKLNE